MEKIYTLGLGQWEITDTHKIFRVPGGWIFYIGGAAGIFVPFDNEFQTV